MLRVMPPLTVKNAEINAAVAILHDVLEEVQKVQSES